MRLQSLEIKGFKSFPDKTIINFDNKITGIVGPNGCGKSNIIDAIRWVVGEQKIANLRSENLESLVFNGSKTRASSGVAEVVLTFENTKNILPTEYSTVAISRRFYKTGDSEYRLNDVVCRLKDIQNLLLDTGIGSDSYSIIELAMVDDLIKDKDNSRRKLLEQAAGITIYKIRKKEAKQKLELTQTDLARVEDVLFEIAEQMKVLETQAKKAEKYNELKVEYKKHSVVYAKITTDTFNQSLHATNVEIQTFNDELIKIEVETDALNAVVEGMKLQTIEKEKILNDLQKKYNELLNNINQVENDKKLIFQKKEYLSDKEKNVVVGIANAESQLLQLKDAIALTQEQIQEQENQLTESKRHTVIQKEKLENGRNLIEIKKQHLENIRSENKKWQMEQFDLEKKIAVAETSLHNVNANIHQIKIDVEKRKENHELLFVEKENVQYSITQTQKEFDGAKEKNQVLKALIIEQQESLESEREKLVIENRILDAKKNEYELLKNVVEKMEGYPESVKFLFNNQNWVNRQIPILSDVIYVQEAYKITIENYLHQYLNYYVVQNREEAIIAVELLFTNQKGKANFLILDEIASLKINEKNNADYFKGLKPALEILEIEEMYKPLFQHLLGDVYIYEEWSDKFLEGLLKDAVFISKNGKIIHQKFSIGGGSIGLFEGNKIGRVKNLEKHLQFIQEQTLKVDGQKQNIASIHQQIVLKNGEIKENEVQQLQTQLNLFNNQKFALDNKIDSILNLDKTELKKTEELEKVKGNYEESILVNKNGLEYVKIDFEKTTEALKNSLSEFEKLSNEFSVQQDIYNQTNLTYSQKENYLNTLKQELKFKTEQIETLSKNLENNKIEIQNTTDALLQLQQELEKKEAEIIHFYRQKEIDNKQLTNEETDCNQFKSLLYEKENELKQLAKSKDINEKQIALLKDKASEIKIELTGLKERLSAEFQIDLAAINEIHTETDLSQEDLKNLIDKTKKRLENLGEINPMAIDAFQEIKHRNDTIITQKQDIINAKESLLQTIQEVEITANQKFLETFNQVKDNFRKVFKALFTEEDECDLILENPENLAETGVNILAKPKGKKPSSITQLSGGEKTLTATALLFAIYLIKPAPFCILDEVDAPLDDTNVAKFTNMIRKFSEESQFIIVTHNKTTMSTVDVIYGVTMQELGVSKLVPVDFRNLV